MQPIMVPAAGAPGFSRPVTWSIGLHALVLGMLLLADVLSPRPVVFRDAIQVSLVPPREAPDAALVPKPAPVKETAPPEAPPKPPPPPQPQVSNRPALAPLEENPLWQKLRKAPAPPPKVDSQSMTQLWEEASKQTSKSTPAESAEEREDLSEWWYEQMSEASPVAEPVEVEIPEKERLTGTWDRINAELPEAVRLADTESGEVGAAGRGELGEWWLSQVDMALAPEAARRGQAVAIGGTPKYLALVERRVNSRWSPPDIFRDRKEVGVTLAFEIKNTGDLVRVKVLHSSGSSYYDQAAIRAVLLSGPFPPFPKEMTENAVEVRFTFSLERGKLG
ncbi:MAG: energy transducer TonB [Leptospirillia bacterium]